MLDNEFKKLIDTFFHPSFLLITVLGNILLIVSVVLLYIFEVDKNPKLGSFIDALYWGVATITTVGYGDIVPVTFVGKIISIVLMFTGTVLFVSFTGILVTHLMRPDVKKESIELLKIQKDIENLKQSLLDIKTVNQRHQDQSDTSGKN